MDCGRDTNSILNKSVENSKKVWIFNMLKMDTSDICQLHVLSEYLVESHCRRVKKRPILFVAISHRWAIKFYLSYQQVFCIYAFFHPNSPAYRRRDWPLLEASPARDVRSVSSPWGSDDRVSSVPRTESSLSSRESWQSCAANRANEHPLIRLARARCPTHRKSF